MSRSSALREGGMNAERADMSASQVRAKPLPPLLAFQGFRQPHGGEG